MAEHFDRSFMTPFDLWRNRAVMLLATMVTCAAIYASLAAGAVPFPTAVSLAESAFYIAADPLDWASDSLQRYSVLTAGAGLVAMALFVRARSRVIRWAYIGAAIALVLPALPLLAMCPSCLLRETFRVFEGPMDGEAWEFVPLAMGGWWILLWIAVAVVEAVVPIASSSAVHGFTTLAVDQGSGPTLSPPDESSATQQN